MDGPRFDAWTRRRFGLLAGGLAAGLLRLSAADPADARKRKKKPRCRPLRFECNDKNRHKRCCPGLFCAEVEGLGDADRCCQAYRSPCRDDSECCGFAECEVITGLDNDERCCGDEGGPCGAKLDCCGNLACDTVGSSSGKQCCLEVQQPGTKSSTGNGQHLLPQSQLRHRRRPARGTPLLRPARRFLHRGR